MLIFGRSPNALIAVLTGIFDLVILFGVFTPTAAQIAGVHGVVGLIILYIANDQNTAINAGTAAAVRKGTP